MSQGNEYEESEGFVVEMEGLDNSAEHPEVAAKVWTVNSLVSCMVSMTSVRGAFTVSTALRQTKHDCFNDMSR